MVLYMARSVHFPVEVGWEYGTGAFTMREWQTSAVGDDDSNKMGSGKKEGSGRSRVTTNVRIWHEASLIAICQKNLGYIRHERDILFLESTEKPWFEQSCS